MAPTDERPRGLVNPRLAKRVAITRRYLAFSVAVGLGSTLCVIVQAVALGTVVQRALIAHAPLARVTPLLLLLAGAFAAKAVLAWIGEVVAHRTSARVTSTLRRDLLRRAVALGPSWLAGERTGELTASATQGIDALDTYFARYLPTAVLAGLAPAGVLAWVLWSDWKSFSILAVTVAVVPVFMILLGLEAKRQAENQWGQLSGLAATFFDLLQGLPTLRAFNRTVAGRQELEQSNDRFRRSTMETLRVAFLSSAALEVLGSVGTALVALFLGLRLIDGTVHLGMALSVLVLAPEVYLPLRRAGAEFHASAEGQAAAERILDLLDESGPLQAATVGGGAKPCPSVACNTVALSRVTVRYPHRALPILDGASISIEPGEHLAIVGPSGSGKSTLLHLLLGFTVPDQGAVTLAGQSLAELSLRDWRQQLAWVPQKPYLISGTIAENLRVGDPGAGGDALVRAAELSGLSDLLARLPQGLKTPVGQGGFTLSAGERQRIALGRAVLRNAPLVLLDEPTAHLDPDREAALRDSLDPWLTGRTVIVAAHRGGVVGRVDRTVTLLSGHLVDVTPDALSASEV